MGEPEYIEKVVAKALKASPAINALCGKRVFAVKIPQGTKFPIVVYQRIYSEPEHTLLGYSAERVVLMVNSFALDHATAKELSLTVRRVLVAHPIKAILRNETDLYNDGSGAFCISAEYLCYQQGGFCYG